MKKVILLSLLLLTLTACGGSYNSEKEKIKLVEKAYQGNQKANEELERILEDLIEKSINGDKKADSEMEEWNEVMKKVRKKF